MIILVKRKSRLDELEMRNALYYHGSPLTGLKNLNGKQITISGSNFNKKLLKTRIVWITPDIEFAYSFTENTGSVYLVKPTRKINIFNALSKKDWNTLTLTTDIRAVNGKSLNSFLADMALGQGRMSLTHFRKIMSYGEWGDLSKSGMDRTFWINSIFQLGYDGYQEHEGLGFGSNGEPATSIGVFNPANLKIINEISAVQIRNKYHFDII